MFWESERSHEFHWCCVTELEWAFGLLLIFKASHKVDRGKKSQTESRTNCDGPEQEVSVCQTQSSSFQWSPATTTTLIPKCSWAHVLISFIQYNQLHPCMWTTEPLASLMGKLELRESNYYKSIFCYFFTIKLLCDLFEVRKKERDVGVQRESQPERHTLRLGWWTRFSSAGDFISLN